ncbi:MAG: hypothetical protein NXI20_17920 [bacterium]|nr:hypothetical protein [bacterium]
MSRYKINQIPGGFRVKPNRAKLETVKISVVQTYEVHFLNEESKQLAIKDIENNERTCGLMTTGIEYSYRKVGKGLVLTNDH